jgi:DNA ligase-1
VIKYRSLYYRDMVDLLRQWDPPEFIIKLIPVQCNSPEELQAYFAQCLADGHEGVCFRTFRSPMWKCTSADGRSTFAEQWLVKWKAFHEAEAEIVGVEEEMHNDNAPTVDARGLQVRSSHQGNMCGKNRLGALVCKLPGGTVFKIGTGFTAQQRVNLWLAQVSLVGQLVTFKSQQYGEHEAPRIPIFKAIRNPRDIS